MRSVKTVMHAVGLVVALLALGGCDTPPRSDGPPREGKPEPDREPIRESRSESGGGTASTPSKKCPPGKALGVIATEGDKVYINGRPARDGDEVCDGDDVTTGDDSSAHVVIGDDRESDSVQLDANTDPRFRRLLSGCVLVDNLHRGRLYATQRGRRGCLIYEVQGRHYYQSGATVNVRMEPDAGARKQPRLAEFTVIRGEVRPMRTTTSQLLTLRAEQLEPLKLDPARLHSQITVVGAQDKKVTVSPQVARKSTDWTARFKLKPNAIQFKRLQFPEDSK